MLLRVDTGEGRGWLPVTVETDGEPTGAELVSAFLGGGLVSSQHRARMRLSRTGEPLDSDRPLSSLGVRHGDRVIVAEADAATDVTQALIEVVVGSGPDIGHPTRLSAGGLVVGRMARLSIRDDGLSREHFRLDASDDGLQVRDLGSRNGTFHAGVRIAAAPVDVDAALPIEAGESLLRVTRAGDSHRRPHVRVTDGLALFNRAPRVAPASGARTVPIAPPPEERQRQRLPWIASLAPLLLAPTMAISLDSPLLMLGILLSPLMMLGSWVEDRSHGGKDHRAAVAAFQASLRDSSAELREQARRSAAELWLRHPDPWELLARCLPGEGLWERREIDEDFLHLRAGWAEQETPVRYELPDSGDKALRTQARETLDAILHTSTLPVTLALADLGSIGVVDDRRDRSLAVWLIFQAAVLHSPRVVQVAAIVPDAAEWDWVARLPHARGFTDSPAVADRNHGPALLGEISRTIEDRLGASQGALGAQLRWPRVILLVDDRVEIPRNLTTDILEYGPAVGVHVVWCTDAESAVPVQCQAIVDSSSGTLRVTWVDSGHQVTDAARDRVPPELIDEAAWQLAGIRDADHRERGADIPSRVSLPDVVGMTDPKPADVARLWSRAEGLSAPVGKKADGLFTLDLRADGPHGLLGGTTGAGKSELLQTLVASFAAHNSPSELTFLLVDYKGGAAFKDCVDLPHTVGYVTDLDGHLVTRVLTSLNAELHYRERRLAEAGAKDLLDMMKKAPGKAPPSLLVVVDEFAALATELPEFVDGMVNLAQRGRSLGIHLLLATQRPAGAINDNIRANTNLRMSLRMNDTSDSDDVIGSPLAAQLPRSLPGRAYVRTGSTELTEVQIAYSGGREFGKVARQRSAVTLSFAGKPSTTILGPVPTAENEDSSDLQHLVSVIGQAFADSGLAPPRKPWLPPLDDVVPVPVGSDTRGLVIGLGVRDVPRRQAQRPHLLDLGSAGSVLIAGSAGSGKTSAIRTIVGRLAEQNSPAELHVYLADFGARGFAALAGMPHVGDIIVAEEQERMIRLLGMMQSEIARRRRWMSDAGVSSFEALREQREVPYILLALDGYSSFEQVFEKVEYGRWVDALPTLIGDGGSVGIRWLLTVDRRLALPMSLQSALDQRLLLRFNDPDEHQGFGVDRLAVLGADAPPGRGLTLEGEEFQLYTYGDETPAGQAEALRGLSRRLAEQHPGVTRPPQVRLLPRWASTDDLPGPDAALGEVAYGIRDHDFDAATLNLARTHALVVGSRRSGKTTALATVARQLAQAGDVELVLLAPRATPLSDSESWSRVVIGLEAISDWVEETLLELDERDSDAPWLVIVIDDAHEFADELVDERLEELLRHGTDRRVRVVAAADKRAAHRAYGGLLMALRSERAGIILQPDPDADGDLFDVSIERGMRGGPPGRALAATEGVGWLVQVAGGEPPE